MALGAEATFVARTLDNDRQHLTEVLRQAAAHQGTAFVEIYQNCNVFNDGAFDVLREKPQGVHNQIRLVHGRADRVRRGDALRGGGGQRPARDREHRRHAPRTRSSCTTRTAGPRSRSRSRTSRTARPSRRAIGVFREFERPVYGQAMTEQLARATERLGKGDLGALLHSGDTWTVG